MAWRYVLTDLNGGSIGELRASSRSLSVGISKPATASFRIRADDPLWTQTTPGEAKLRIYNSVGTLVFYGPIVADEETASGQGASVQVTAADQSWVLGKRYFGKDQTGVGTTYTATDSGSIAYAILAAVNADAPTGVTQGSKDAFVTRTITYLWKRALDAVNELGAIQGSYEWQLRYVDAATPTVYLDLLAAVGSDKTANVFLEYGTGLNNCKAYTRARSLDLIATRVWVLGSGSTIATQAYDAGAEGRYGRFEDVVSYGDIAAAPLLDSLASAHVAIRDRPRTLVSLTPLVNLSPLYGVDWLEGDFVSARVVAQDTVRVDGFARIWAAQISIDEQGNEQGTFTLEPQ